MGRRYVVGFENVTVSAPQDLVVLWANNGSFPKAFAKLLRCWVMCTDTTLPAAQQLSLRVVRKLSLAPGSGGSANEPQPDDPGDPVSQYFSQQNDTSLSTGSSDWQYDLGCYLYTGADLVFSDAPSINGLAGFAFVLLSTVSTPVKLSGGILFEEFGSGV